MKICISSSSFPLNSGDLSGCFVLELAKTLAKQGHQIFVLCPQIKDKEFCSTYEGVHVTRFRYAIMKKSQNLIGVRPGITNVMSLKQLVKVPFFLLCQAFALYRLAKKENIEAINSHWLIPQGVTAAVVASLLKIKHIPTLHSTDVFLARKLPMRKMICRFVENTSCQTFIVSNFVRQRYEGILGHASGARVMPMGIDTLRFNRWCKNSDDCKATILFVGRLLPIKGVKHLIASVPYLIDQSINVLLTIVGDGEESENLMALARTLKIEEHINFIGRVRNVDLPTYYNKAKVVAVPSLLLPSGETEGMPVVILEAMACGVPVVASNVGGASDIIKDDQNGYLVEPANPVRLAEALLKAISNYERLAAAAYETGQLYSWERVAKEYIDSLGVCRV